MSRVPLRFRLGLLYDRYSERLRLDPLVERLTPHAKAQNVTLDPTSIEGDVPPIRFLVGTTRAGLLLIDGPRITRLFDGRDFFGITRHRDRWFAFSRYGTNGRIISFRLEDGRAVDARTELAGLSRGVHQIDFFDGHLWIVDTYLDRLLQVPIESIGKDWRRSVRKHYPAGQQQIGRGRRNHAHFNSIYRTPEGILLVAHNETTKTARGSELFLLDHAGDVIGRELMGGSCCHNIAILDGERVVCHSVEGAVAREGTVVLSLGDFVRGLSVANDYNVIGTSPMGADKIQRDSGIGRVVITDPGFEPVATISFEGTQIQEIRRVDRDDLGLSATQYPDLGLGA